jgi:hypothetical protein
VGRLGDEGPADEIFETLLRHRPPSISHDTAAFPCKASISRPVIGVPAADEGQASRPAWRSLPHLAQGRSRWTDRPFLKREDLKIAWSVGTVMLRAMRPFIAFISAIAVNGLFLAVAGLTMVSGPAPAVVSSDPPNPCPPERTGTNGDDRFVGTTEDDAYLGLAGADRARGLGGRDCLEGNDGDDSLRGGAEADTQYGGDDHDRLRGGSGPDVLQVDRESQGADILVGGRGADRIEGGTGSDRIFAGRGDDRIDAVSGGKADAVIACGRGRDRVVTNPGQPTRDDCEKMTFV